MKTRRQRSGASSRGRGEAAFRVRDQVREVIKDDDGNVIELRCTHLPDTRRGRKGIRRKKVKGIIHWLSEARCKRATVNLYDRLFNAPVPGAGHEDSDFLEASTPVRCRCSRTCRSSRSCASHPARAYSLSAPATFIDEDSTEDNDDQSVVMPTRGRNEVRAWTSR